MQVSELMHYTQTANHNKELDALCCPVKEELDIVRQRIQEHLCCIDHRFKEDLIPFYDGIDRRLRAAFTLLSSRTLGSVNYECIEAATIHLATLFHENILEECPGDSRFGGSLLLHNTAFILIGDFLLSHVFTRGFQLKKDQARFILRETVEGVFSGKLQKAVSLDPYKLDEEQYFRIVHAETAALFAASCRLGAVLSGASSLQTETLCKFGDLFGRMFQITRDLLVMSEIYKNPGSPAFETGLTGNNLFPVIHWLRQSHADYNGDIFSKGEDLKVFNQIFQSESIDYTVNTVKQLAREAKSKLELLPKNQARHSLAGFVDCMVSSVEDFAKSGRPLCQ
jgi:octaprenyl-diphosphate synthase